ncbi:MAG: Orotate phosphoribosyltransferase [Chlamydiae bacterium]|nr:Orotate phosphoribosyltransferase [Chlamydiota bacterium]
MEDLIGKLYSLGVIRLGSFALSKDFLAPFSVDYRAVISQPSIARSLCTKIEEKAERFSFDLLCGLPPLGACLANYIAWEKDHPLILCTEKGGEIGTEERVIGMYKTGQKALLIIDVLSFGGDVLDTIESLEEEGVVVKDVICCTDLEIGGKQRLKKRGYRSHSLFSISEALEILNNAGKIPGDSYKLAEDFLEGQKADAKR